MWRIKVLIQFVLGYLPGGERLNFALQNARGAYSERALLSAFLSQATHCRMLNERAPIGGATVVELGPGWKGIGGVVLSLFGAARIHSYDHVPHLRFDLMRRLLGAIAADIPKVAETSGLDADELAARVADMQAQPDLDALLAHLNVTYHAPADAGQTGLPDRSVDLVYSYGVLEHVPPETLVAITAESARILKPTGRAFHNIGTHDHYATAGLGNEVNFLRYPEWLWRLLVGNKIAYHNRLRESQFLKVFAEHGATVLWHDRVLTDANLAALKGLRLDRKFRGLDAEDLAVSAVYIDLGWPEPSRVR